MQEAGNDDGFHLRVTSQTFTITAGNEVFGLFSINDLSSTIPIVLNSHKYF